MENERKSKIKYHEEKKIYNKKYNKNYIRNRKEKKEIELYHALLAMINRDNELLSTKSEMSDIEFAKYKKKWYYGHNGNSYVETVIKLSLKEV